QWAAEDAKAKGIEKPVFVHTGDNHPYPNAPKKACGEYAAEVGLTVASPVVVPLKPGDFKAQCLTIKETGAHYVYMGNLGGSVVSLLKSCGTVGVEATYMGNPWAGDYLTVEASQGEIIFPSSSAFFGQDVPGMETVKAVIANGDGMGDKQVTHHYIRGICTVFFMKEAMEWAKANGGITGENIKKGMYQKSDWVPAGMEGVCLPSTWTAEDHRGLMTVAINRGTFVDGKAKIERVTETTLPRRDDWLGQ
ncbi:MAG: ABC transporter substrate-binding protein, partial [Pseudomonadota bacterium]